MLYIEYCSTLIQKNNITELNTIYNDFIDKNQDMNFDIGYVYQKLFLKACLYGTKEILKWFLNVYKNKLPPIIHITQKHTLIYGKYLIHKKRDKNMYKWYVQYVTHYV